MRPVVRFDGVYSPLPPETEFWAVWTQLFNPIVFVSPFCHIPNLDLTMGVIWASMGDVFRVQNDSEGIRTPAGRA